MVPKNYCWRYFIISILFLFVSVLAGAQGFLPLKGEIGLNHLYDQRAHIGGGAVIIDINNDGFMDVYLPGGKGPEKVYLNVNGEELVDISTESGVTFFNNYYTVGGVAGDVNNDGYEDLFITTWQFVETWGGPNFNVVNLLMINNGDNTFTSYGGIAGILNPSFSAAATLLDVNYDGFLDIYVANYVDQVSLITDSQNGQVIGFDHECYENLLYVSNQGQTYQEMAEVYGVHDAGCAMAVAGTDFNRDGFTDLMVVNDFGQWVLPNKLYAGDGVGFSDVSAETGAELGFYGMGVAVGDYDEDGDMDYYMTNLGNNILLQQNPGETFSDVALGAGVLNGQHNDVLATGWGTFFFDYDNDSYLDLYVSNGRIPSASFLNNAMYDPNKLYRNNHDGTFTDIAPLVGLRDTAVGRGAVYVDFNNDGLLDILQVNVFDPPNLAPNGTVLYLNQTENDNNYVMFSLNGVTANPHGIGARVELIADGRTLIREVGGGSSHASHNDKRVHFGLGTISTIDTVLIYWPGSIYPQIVESPEINQIHEIVQVEVITDIAETEFRLVNRIFPNPTSGTLIIEFNTSITGAVQIVCSDLSGKMLFRTERNAEGTNIIRLDQAVSQLAGGMYLIQVSDGIHSSTFRLAVAR